MWPTIWMLADFVSTLTDPPYEVVPTVQQYFGTETIRALSVFWCESLHMPSAVSVTDDHGVAQISRTYWLDSYRHLWPSIYEVETNIKIGHEIWVWGETKWGDGFVLWTCGRM